ncbi:TetR/AcrR family transcriptional regulator [Fodinicola feengrottensis]|uniref:TetR/AcrR family transcriptional regulator n=2 Tax=Fodinicola feengrottensis TaxID=435914 RepID=A0ABP4SG24_9ACTN
MPGTRDRILDAFVDQLIEHGIATVTIEKVAERAGVSKGGLLYHFPAKPALVEGLADRLRAFTDANLARADKHGVVRTFLETSSPDSNEARHYWAVISAVQADPGSTTDRTRSLLAAVFEDWSTRLRAAISDPILADIIRFTGDGLYLTAVTGLPLPSNHRIQNVIRRLLAEADKR